MRVLYVAGLGRSGTTMVSEYLATHLGGWCIGEAINVYQLGVVSNELCQCGLPFYDCSFWREVGRVAFGGWTSFRQEPALHSLKTGALHQGGVLPRRRVEHARRYARNHLALLRATSAVTGRRLVIDSSKFAATAAWLKQEEPQIYVLHLVRDSRAVAWSWSKHVRRPESGDHATYMDQFTAVESSRLWNRTNGLLELQRLANLRLRYEDFCRQPTDLVDRVKAELGLHPEAAIGVSPRSYVHSEHAIGGNPRRFDAASQQVEIDGDWRSLLSKRVRRQVTVRTQILLARYGYSPSRGFVAKNVNNSS